MEEKDAIKALAALAQPNRLQIFRVLVVAGEDGASPGFLAERLGLAPATLSFHLKELANGGLVNQERKGRSLIYRVEYQHMNALLAYLTKNCCQDKECLDPAVLSFKC